MSETGPAAVNHDTRLAIVNDDELSGWEKLKTLNPEAHSIGKVAKNAAEASPAANPIPASPETEQTPETFSEKIKKAFGETVATTISPEVLYKLEHHQTLRDLVLNAVSADVHGTTYAKIFENNQELQAKLIAALKTKPKATTNTPATNAPQPVANTTSPDNSGTRVADGLIADNAFDAQSLSLGRRASGLARYYTSKPWIWLASRNDKYAERYKAASPKERLKMERKANVIGWLGAAAGFAVVVGTRGFGLWETSHHGQGQNLLPGHDDPSNPGNFSGLSPEQMFERSHQTEMDFLNTNGRMGNDFNNIPVDGLNEPGNNGHFPGYEALQNQYLKSPHELAAEMRQIQEIEQANGHSFDPLPADLRMHPGESHDAYTARLSDAIARDDALHTKMTSATLDYIKQHGQPIRNLTEGYSSDYVVIENGQPTIKLADYVTSADPNDKVIMLSDTKGIRYPCGQPIEIKPVVETPAPAPVGLVAEVIPQDIPQQGYVPDQPYSDQQYYQQDTPLPRRRWQRIIPQRWLQGKQDPAAFAANPDLRPAGPGTLETHSAPVQQTTVVNGVTERAHTTGGAPANRSSGLPAPGATTHVTQPTRSPVSGGSGTSNRRVGKH